MPTPKQVRYHYNRVMKLNHKLARALIDAHNADVIQYEGYDMVSPCQANSECRERIKKTCEKQLAQAMHDEIRKGNWY